MTHHSSTDITAAAEDIGEGWSRATVILRKGDTCHNPGSTKWVFAGPGTVTFAIHATGWGIEASEGLTRKPLR